MRKIYTLLVMLLPIISMSKGKDELSGHWHEVKRLDAAGKAVSYSDTILFEFKVGNEYIWQKKGGFIYRGSYKKENGALDIGMRYFTIQQHKTNKRLILKDQSGTYEFEPYTPSSGMVAGRAPEQYKPVTSISQMVGSWDKFKGTASGTQQQIDYTRAVKKLEIFDTPIDGMLGVLYAGMDGTGDPSWYVERFSNQTLYCKGKDERQFKVLKAENNELIIEEDGFTYFMRRFKK